MQKSNPKMWQNFRVWFCFRRTLDLIRQTKQHSVSKILVLSYWIIQLAWCPAILTYTFVQVIEEVRTDRTRGGKWFERLDKIHRSRMGLCTKLMQVQIKIIIFKIFLLFSTYPCNLVDFFGLNTRSILFIRFKNIVSAVHLVASI